MQSLRLNFQFYKDLFLTTNIWIDFSIALSDRTILKVNKWLFDKNRMIFNAFDKIKKQNVKPWSV